MARREKGSGSWDTVTKNDITYYRYRKKYDGMTSRKEFVGGSLTVGYQKKVPAGRIKPAFFVSNFWFLSIVFYCNVL